MILRVFQKGFNYSQDGQGNRLVYHLQGCNMKCPWCANPEGMSPLGVIVTENEWLVEELCPYGAIQNQKLNRELCERCEQKMCLKAKHRSKGIRLSCETVELEEIFEEILSSSPMFYDGGGVTFTGGEATMQFDALKELLIRLKEAGIHTAIETNGSHPRLPELFPYVDQLMMDCKHWSTEKHQEFTGVGLETTKRNLRLAAERGKQLDVRIPLIGGVNDSEKDMREFIKFFHTFANENVTFEILKYHEFGKKKWQECGWDYQMTENANVTYAQIQQFRQLIQENGLIYKKS